MEIGIYAYKSGSLDMDDFEQWQLEIGSTASDYVPYRAPSTSSVVFGQTVYGGTAEIVAGTGSEEWVCVNAKDVSWSNTGDEGIYTTFSDKKMSTQTAISDTFNARTYTTSNRVGWTDSTPTRAEKLAIIANGNVHIAYILATPTPYTFPPASNQLLLSKGKYNAWAETYNAQNIVGTAVVGSAMVY